MHFRSLGDIGLVPRGTWRCVPWGRHGLSLGFRLGALLALLLAFARSGGLAALPSVPGELRQGRVIPTIVRAKDPRVHDLGLHRKPRLDVLSEPSIVRQVDV